MTISSFGTRLRQQREKQQVAISAIAEQTKINPALIEALERDDVSSWPSGIFRRAYIRAYAQAIGLDAEAAVREFLAVHPDAVDVLPPGATVWPDPDESAQTPPPGRLVRMITSARAAVPAILRRPRNTEAATTSPAAAANKPAETAGPVPGLSTAAHLCARLARVRDLRELTPILADAAQALGAVGLIVWCADPQAARLTPSVVHGYPDAVRARLTSVPTVARNAVAAAFRSADVRVVDGDGTTGALVVPIVGGRGCVGVLALELPHRSEHGDVVRAFATILAAQVAPLMLPAPAEAGRYVNGSP